MKIGRGIYDKERKKERKIFFSDIEKMKMQLKMGDEIIEGIMWFWSKLFCGSSMKEEYENE